MTGGLCTIASLFLFSAIEAGVTSGERVLVGHEGCEGAGADGVERIVKRAEVGGNA